MQCSEECVRRECRFILFIKQNMYVRLHFALLSNEMFSKIIVKSL